MKKKDLNQFFLFAFIFISFGIPARTMAQKKSEYNIDGPLRKYQPVRIDFTGPESSAAASEPNPFLDFRLTAVFTSASGTEYRVPGFYNGDGRGGNAGKIWTVRFTPVEEGKWNFNVSFEKGEKIAVQDPGIKGEPANFHNIGGDFFIEENDNSAEGFYKKGMLLCSGTHYLRFSDGAYWLKGGTDSPEDFLAYSGFSNTPYAGHVFSSHVKDWNEGDPDWGKGEGKGIIGALNYLAGKHVNSVYFLTMNIGGDGKNVWPFLSEGLDVNGNPDNDNLHYDIGKLEQWNTVFTHAQEKGIFLHFVFNEGEEANKRELDDGKLGVERKLYYREMIARFSHHPALQWNLCEEYNIKHKLEPALVKEFASYIHSVDPYNHPISVHHAGTVEKAWSPFIGDEYICVSSFQTNDLQVVKDFRRKSEAAGHPLVIGMDEFFPDKSAPENFDRHRKEYIWPVYFSGGNIEFILDELLKTDDFRKYEPLWDYLWNARQFNMEYIPFQEMHPADSLLKEESIFEGQYGNYEGRVFAREPDIYAVYLPVTENTGELHSGVNGIFIQQWYNPRIGRFVGEKSEVVFSEERAYSPGPPPGEPDQDWVILFTKKE